MSKISQDTIVGIDVSRDWLDIHCLPDGASLRWPNIEDGHTLIAGMPELEQITGEQAAALTGLAPIARDSAATRGRRAIGGGR